MKKILGLAVAALLVMGLVGGGTWAYFSDPEASGTNSLTAGTLDLEVEGGSEGTPVIFSVSDLKPGDNSVSLGDLENVGNLPGEFDIAIGALSEVAGASGEFAGGTDLGTNLDVAIYLDIDESGTWTSGDIGLTNADNTTYNHPTALDYQSIGSYASKSWDAIYTMGASDTDDIAIAYQIGTGVGNSIQGDAAEFTITFTLEQAGND